MINKRKSEASLSSGEYLIKYIGFALIFVIVFVGSPCKAATLSKSIIEDDPFESQQKGGYKPSVPISDLMNTLQANLNQANELVKSGLASFEAGDKDKALSDLERAWSIDPQLEIAGIMVAYIHIQAQRFNEALEAAKKLQTNHPNKPSGYNLAGIAYAGLKQQEQSKSSFQSAFKINPGNLDAGSNLAAYLVSEGKVNQAIDLLNAVLDHNPEHLRTTQWLAELEYNSQHYEKAVSLLQRAIDKHQEEMEPYILLARVYLARKEPQKALSLAEKALKKFPDNTQFLGLVGMAQLKMGRPTDAVTAFTSAVNISPKEVSPHYNLAIAYEQLKQLAPATKEVKIALELDPENVPAQFLHARLLAKSGEIQAAQEILKKLSVSNPKSADIKELEGQIALAQNNPVAAVTLYKEAVKDRENNFLSIQLATAQMLAGEKNAGEATLRDWLNKYPNDILTRSSLADLLISQEKFDESLEQYLEVIRQKPELASVHNNIAWLFLQKGDLDKALKHAEKANEKAPEDAAILDTLGVILLRKGQNEKALSLLQKAEKNAPNNQNIRLHLAQVFMGMDQSEKAKKVLSELRIQELHSKESEQAQQLIKDLKIEK